MRYCLKSDETQHDDVLDAVMKLPEKYKDVVYLHYYEGYKTEEMAKMLKRPVSTVRNQLRDAREKLKVVLGGIGQHRTINGWRLCRTLACIFSVILHRNFLTYVSMPAKFLYNLTKNLTAQSHDNNYAVLP